MCIRDRSKTYALIYQQGADCVKILFEPNEKILRALRHSVPGKLVR